MESSLRAWTVLFLLVLSYISIIASASEAEDTADPCLNPEGDGSASIHPLNPGEVSGILGASPLIFEGVEDASFEPHTGSMSQTGSPYKTPKSGLSTFFNCEEPTRASDAEGEADQHDLANGSLVQNEVETIDGTLKYDPDTGGSPDWRDWYKVKVEDIDESPNAMNGVRNISVELLSYTDGNDGYVDLFEISVVNDALGEDFGDFLTISLLYFDPWAGLVDMGNSDLWFDDQDDTDGWVWDGDNALYPGMNWTTPFVTPVNSEGDPDPDGFANGYTEVGWYFIGISLDFYVASQQLTRDAFTVKYTLKIDTGRQEDTDQGSNSFEDAEPYSGTDTKHLNSRFNQVDWYRMEGSDPEKLWNITFTMDRHVGYGYIDGNLHMDNWIWTFIVWRTPGEDELWNTDDDGWTYDYVILTFFLEGGRFVSNAEQNLSFTYRSRSLENLQREVYIGLVMEPVMVVIDNDEIQGFYYYSPDTSWNNYTMDINIVEELPNNAPALSELKISSDWEGEETGGNLDSQFTFEITYTDEDNDPPDELDLVLDPGTPDENVIDMTVHEADTGDTDYTDGKDYSIMLTGEEIDDEPYPHVVMVNASDRIPVESIRVSMGTGNIYYNDTLHVWDDEPVFINPISELEIDVMEDDLELQYFLGSRDGGPFVDPEGSFILFEVWDPEEEEWGGAWISELLEISVEQDEFGSWFASITPLPNQNGMEMIRFRGADEHSNVTADVIITVEAVNDPPLVKSVTIDGTKYDVDNTDPYKPMFRLDELYRINEDEETEVRINAVDMDNEDENVALTYSYLETLSDNWRGRVEVDANTGEVTMVPDNEDAKRGNEIVVVEVSDGGQGNRVELHLHFDVLNVEDPPEIAFPSGWKTEWERGEKIDLTPIATDIDPGHVLKYSINMDDELGSVDPISDQIPYASLEKGEDWDFNELTGRFTFQIDDAMIWKTSTGPVEDVEITLVFRVEDETGQYAEDSIVLSLKYIAPSIPAPETWGFTIHDEYPETTDLEGYNVTLYCHAVYDEFGQTYECKWMFEDGTTVTGWNINHTYTSIGWKTVNFWLEGWDQTTDKIPVRYEIKPIPEPPKPPKIESDGIDPVIVIAIVVIVIVIIIIAGLLFWIMRRKPPVAGEEGYYGEDQRRPGAQSAPSLGSGAHSREVSPAGSMDRSERLPSSRDEALPPVDLMRCPHCGTRVKKDWFLCPQCKSPLD